jgi:hypothetical protein
VNYLHITNATKEPLQVFIQYYTPTVSGNFRWYPDDPSTGLAINLRLDPGQSDYLIDKKYSDMRIKGAKFRVWAKGINSDATATAYKDKDLIAAPAEGYIGHDYRTFYHTFQN